MALGIATAAEVKRLDKRDHAVVKTVLTNFKKIEADLPNYVGAPACNLSTGKLSLTSPCFGCADAEYHRCKETPLTPGATASCWRSGRPRLHFVQIADSYRCFVLTQRETAAAFKQIKKIPKMITP